MYFFWKEKYKIKETCKWFRLIKSITFSKPKSIKIKRISMKQLLIHSSVKGCMLGILVSLFYKFYTNISSRALGLSIYDT